MQFPELERITLNPMIMGGKPCIRGMRITVGTIVGLVASGASFEEIRQLYPYLESEDIRAAVAYAAWRARNALADRLKILLDMNLSPSWIASLESGGHSAVHWSSVASPSALDTEIMAWARENRYIVFTKRTSITGLYCLPQPPLPQA
jgi:uncharacterized protein (DUF433 family)